MKLIRYLSVLCILICVFTMSVYAEDWFWGEPDDMNPGTEEASSTHDYSSTEEGSTEVVTQDATEITTELISTDPIATTAPAETETTIPEESTTTPSEESVTDGETTEPAETEPESGEGSTERPDVQTTEPIETPSESASPSESATPSESETQPEQGASTLPVSLPLILAGLGVLAVGCIAVVVVVMIKYFRAQRA